MVRVTDVTTKCQSPLASGAVLRQILIFLLSMETRCILSCLSRLNVLIAISDGPSCPRGHPTSPSVLIRTPLNVTLGVLENNENFNINLVIKYRKALTEFTNNR